MIRAAIIFALSCAGMFGQSVSIGYPNSNPTLSGWQPINFTAVLSSLPAATLACWTIDAHPATNPGPVGVISGNLGAFLDAGCVQAPFTFPINTFWWMNGPHQAVVTVYDALGNVLATSSAATFTIANNWPVTCTPAMNVSSPGSTLSGIVTLSYTVTGGCVGDSTQQNWFINGVQQGSTTFNTSTITFDTTTVLNNSQVNIGFAVQDTTNGNSTYPNFAALEWTRPVAFSNTGGNLTVAEVWNNARDATLTLGGPSGGNCDVAPQTAGSCTLIPAAIQNDQTVATGQTFYYGTANSNITLSSSTGASVTETSAAIGNSQVFVMDALHAGTDGNSGSGGTAACSGSGCYTIHTSQNTFTASQNGEMIQIISGTNCLAGSYLIENVQSATAAILGTLAGVGNAPFVTNNGTSCHYAFGPTRAHWASVGTGSHNVAHFNLCGSINTTYVASGSCASRWMAEVFTPVSGFSEQPYPVPFGQAFSTYFNTSEAVVVDCTSGGGYTCSNQLGITGTLANWQGSNKNYLNTQAALISPWPKLRMYCRFDPWWGAPTVYNLVFGIPSGWTTSSVAALLNNVQATGVFTACSLKDEISGDGWPYPLQGPLKFSNSGTMQNWLNTMVCNGTSCTVNYFTTTPGGAPGNGFNTSDKLAITGSATTGMNTVYPALYTISSTATGSFTFANTAVAAGTYNVSNDPGLTIEPLGQYGWIQNNLTSANTIMPYDGWAAYVSQLMSVPHPPIGGSLVGTNNDVVTACWGHSLSTGCGQSLNTANTGGVTISNIFPDGNDIYYTHGGIEYYLLHRASIHALISDSPSAASFELGFHYRSLVDVLDPSVPWTGISQSITTDTAYIPIAQTAVVSCSGNTITFGSPHNITNILQGATRLWIGPQVTIGGGTGAIVTTTVSGGVVTALNLLSGGVGYTGTVTLTISGIGTGATGTATATSGVITSVTLTAGGTGYQATSSDPKCNQPLYVIAAPTATTLSVVYAATQVTCLAGASEPCSHNGASGTITFANGDKIGAGATLLNNAGSAVPLYEMSAAGVITSVGTSNNVFNYGNATISGNGCGALSVPSLASNAVTRDRDQFFNPSGFTGTDASYFNSTTFYYDIANLSVPVDNGGTASTCANSYHEVPVFSGTGGAASIQIDNLHVPGREIGSYTNGQPANPDIAFLGPVFMQGLGFAGDRAYEQLVNYNSYNPTPVTISGTLHPGGFNPTASGESRVFNPSFNSNSQQMGVHCNAEAVYAVPDCRALGFAHMMIDRTFKFFGGSIKRNSPDYGDKMESYAFSPNTANAGGLLMVVNGTDGPQSRTINLCADPRSLCAAGQSIFKYTADAKGILGVTTISAGTMTDSLSLQEGQAAWYTFPVASAQELIQPIIGAKLSDGGSTATQVVVHWAYDPYFLQARPNISSCTVTGALAVCAPNWDKNIGAGATGGTSIYYQLWYLNSSNVPTTSNPPVNSF